MRSRSMAMFVSACSLAAAAAASGCGGSDDSSKASGSDASRKPYVIGNISTATGTFGSTDGAGLLGIKAWAAHVNAHGGINGHPVQLITKDDQSNPTVALATIKQLVATKNLLALVGNVSVTETIWEPVAKAAGVPVVGDFLADTGSYTNSFVFPQGTTHPSIVYGELYSAATLAKATKIGSVYCAEDPVCATTPKQLKQYAPSLHASVVISEAVSATQPNYDAACIAAKKAGAQALVLGLGSSTIISLAQSCASVGYKPVYIANNTGLTAPETSVAALNDRMYGVVNTFPWVNDGTPAQRTFQAAVKAADVPKSSYGVALSNAWTGGVLFETAAKSVTGDLTRTSLMEALWSLPKKTTLGGLAPPLSFKAHAPAGEQKCFSVMKIENGKWTAPYGATKTFCQA